MEKNATKTELLHIELNLKLTPDIHFLKQDGSTVAASENGSFSISADTAISYPSLTNVINGYLVNKQFTVTEGIINKYIIIKNCQVYSHVQDNLVIVVEFGGSHKGTVYVTGQPVYVAAAKQVQLQNYNYTLKTNDFLLKAVKWLFDKKIMSEIKKYTAFDLAPYLADTSNTINSWLSKQWTKGVTGNGSLTTLQITSVQALQHYLLVRVNCAGNVQVVVNEADITFGLK